MNLLQSVSQLGAGIPSLGKTLRMFFVFMLLSGCAAGPEYTGPKELSHDLTTWEHPREAGLTATETEITQWWTYFKDAQLDHLIGLTLENNLDLEQARSRVLEARAQRSIASSSGWPSFGISGSASRGKSGEAPSASLYTSGLDAAWEIDIFGRVRRSAEAATADLEATKERMHAVRVTLLAEVALNYLDVRSFQKRVELAQVNSAIQQQTYDLIRSRQESGLASELETGEGKSTLADIQARIPPLKAGLSRAMHRLAVLVGRKPGVLDEYLTESIGIPMAPPEIPIGIPADLLRRRPDIRQAERELAAQTARVGVATADLYPRFALNGILSFQATQASNLFSTLSRVLSLGPVFQWNIFNAGSVRNNIMVHNERQKQALLHYEKSVLTALEEVENSLVSYARELDRREHLKEAVAASKETVFLAESMYRVGLEDFSHVLDAQRRLFSQEDQLTTSTAEVTGNLIRLYKALGGGWGELKKERKDD